MIGNGTIRRGEGRRIRRLMSNVMKVFHLFLDPFPKLPYRLQGEIYNEQRHNKSTTDMTRDDECSYYAILLLRYESSTLILYKELSSSIFSL